MLPETSAVHADPQPAPVIGVGACLMGSPVRFNGLAKRPNHHLNALHKFFQVTTFCPEVESGMSVPREPIRLVGEEPDLRLLDSNTQTEDYTDQIAEQARRFSTQHPMLSGYVFVKGSPSCGMERVKRYNVAGNPVMADGRGIFAATLMAGSPLMPVEEDGRLHDHGLRENFITRVYVYHEWLQLTRKALSHNDLIVFWSRLKYLVMAHDVAGCREIGRLLANAEKLAITDITERFIVMLMKSLAKPATRKTRTNALQHLCGYLKRDLDSTDRQELKELIDKYRLGKVPLIVPMTILRHHFRRHPKPYIDQQVFMAPYPEDLGLQNQV